jgi:16S rRNA (cytosine1402-N4)-methyltransferase
MSGAYHAPVLLDAIRALHPGARFVLDGTLGGGGHAEAFLRDGADVTGVDRDPDAIAAARARLAAFEAAGRFRAVHATYDEAATHPALGGRTFDLVLLDLGVSSHQLDAEARGFSFRPGVALDMRMAQVGPTAATLLNTVDRETLAGWFRDGADEPRARRLADAIVRRRARAPFATSDDLVNAIRAVLGPGSGPADFARLFQAVRMAVNDELGGLARALIAWRDRLAPDGILAVISYHSGEDRVVKHAFAEWARDTRPGRWDPPVPDARPPLGTVVTRKPIVASAAEVAGNPRARSGKLRGFRAAGGRG